MTKIEELEDQLEKLKAESADEETIKKVQEELAAQRNELTRLSDGCGYPHPQS